jgi:hypothetical protein
MSNYGYATWGYGATFFNGSNFFVGSPQPGFIFSVTSSGRITVQLSSSTIYSVLSAPQSNAFWASSSIGVENSSASVIIASEPGV